MPQLLLKWRHRLHFVVAVSGQPRKGQSQHPLYTLCGQAWYVIVSLTEQVPIEHHGPEHIVLGLEMFFEEPCRQLHAEVVTS